MALLLEWEWQRGAERRLLPLAALQNGSGFGSVCEHLLGFFV